MGVAARDTDILELLIGHFHERKAPSATLHHQVKLAGGGTKHKRQPADEATASRGASMQFSAAVTNCINCIHLAINQAYELYLIHP